MVKKTDATPAAPEPTPADSGSVLATLRQNQVGGLLAGLVVAIAVGLLLSVLVPSDPNVLALIVLGLLMAFAVGFTVRLTSAHRGLTSQAVALVVTALGVHLMVVTGMVGGGNETLQLLGAEGPSFGDALLAALATPVVSSGALLTGLIAVLIVGWGDHLER
ncbi:MAG: hypothetical protein CVT64_09190 [Actinobacteria bacterium HGW-Actinobacteria-4]|nr:MAG: hypothetical protein CVT64_09190 [Actinobacteria bacterium HGW-Actinobacteria-4]